MTPRDDSAQLMVIAAVIVALGLSTLAFTAYSADMSIDRQGTDGSEEDFRNLKNAYADAAEKAFQNYEVDLNSLRGNISRNAAKHGYTVILLPKDAYDGYRRDSFEGRIIVTDGTVTYRDRVNVSLD